MARSELAADQINWPERYRSEDASFTIRNEVEIASSPQVVWELLLQAKARLSWYEGASDVETESGDGETIDAGVTEESPYGLRAGLQLASQPNELRRLHEQCLVKLKKKAGAGADRP